MMMMMMMMMMMLPIVIIIIIHMIAIGGGRGEAEEETTTKTIHRQMEWGTKTPSELDSNKLDAGIGQSERKKQKPRTGRTWWLQH